MKYIRFFCLHAALLLSVNMMPQSGTPDWDSILEELLTLDNVSTGSLEELSLLYESLHDNPLNINRATPAQLAALPFLSDEQIEDIQAYIYMHGPMMSLGELQLTGSLDYTTRQWLRQFVHAGPAQEREDRIRLSDVMQYGRHQLTSGLNIPMYTRAGFSGHTSVELAQYPNRQYLGSRLSHNLRYSFNWNNRIRFGITADKDAGEPFFEKTPPGYDFYSAYIYLQDIGPLQSLAAGRFRASFGYGLLAGSGFSLGLESGQAAAGRRSGGIKPHSGTAESGFLTGIGASVRKGYITYSGLLSYSPSDAILNDKGEISSFKTDGYHRTLLEWSRKHNCRMLTAAANIGYSHQGLDLGITAMADRLSNDFNNRNLFTGIAASWAVGRPGFKVWGETGLATGGVATLENILIRLPGKYDINAMFRYYSPGYTALHANAPAQSESSNELGILIGLNHKRGRFTTHGYADFFRHPEPSYGAAGASDGMDIKAGLQWQMTRSDALTVTARFKTVEKDSGQSGGLEFKKTGNLRLRWDHDLGRGWDCRSQVLLSISGFPDTGTSVGRALTASLSRTAEGMNINVAASAFHTDSYDSALRNYEKGPRYSFGFLTLNGCGIRLSAMARRSFSHGLQLSVKCASTIYTDRNSIGESAQKIDSNHKEDINLQLTWKFQGQ